MHQRAIADNLRICYRKKQIDVSFSCVCPVIDNESLSRRFGYMLWMGGSVSGSVRDVCMSQQSDWIYY